VIGSPSDNIARFKPNFALRIAFFFKALGGHAQSSFKQRTGQRGITDWFKRDVTSFPEDGEFIATNICQGGQSEDQGASLSPTLKLGEDTERFLLRMILYRSLQHHLGGVRIA
jgi:hypothetical protein